MGSWSSIDIFYFIVIIAIGYDPLYETYVIAFFLRVAYTEKMNQIILWKMLVRSLKILYQTWLKPCDSDSESIFAYLYVTIAFAIPSYQVTTELCASRSSSRSKLQVI